LKRYSVTTFGCQMNAHDSERIKGMLEELGLGEAASPDDADVAVFNTCTIREKPDTKLAAYLGDAAARKREHPDMVIAVGGCYAEAQRERLFSLYPQVDVAFGPGTSGPSPPRCRCTANAPSRPGCRSRWAATRRARTASFPRCAGGR
jgi:tRNA-2-methylthio-N6-dimethylallyladenosine synthase